MYFHMYNSHDIFLNYHFVLVLHYDLPIHMSIHEDKYLLFIIYVIEYVFVIKIIIFWSLLVMKQHHICTIKRKITIVHFWSIISFHYCTLKYLSTWECMRIIIVFHHLHHILCISYHDIFIHIIIGYEVALSVYLHTYNNHSIFMN